MQGGLCKGCAGVVQGLCKVGGWRGGVEEGLRGGRVKGWKGGRVGAGRVARPAGSTAWLDGLAARLANNDMLPLPPHASNLVILYINIYLLRYISSLRPD